jgi:hypothetical protein
MNTYTATIELKSQATDVAKQLQLKVSTEGYKEAWVESRRLCRVGGKVILLNDQGEPTETDLAAGQYTVRKVFADAQPKSGKKVLTAADFLAAAETAGIKIPQKLKDLAAELQGTPAQEPVSEAA